MARRSHDRDARENWLIQFDESLAMETRSLHLRRLLAGYLIETVPRPWTAGLRRQGRTAPTRVDAG